MFTREQIRSMDSASVIDKNNATLVAAMRNNFDFCWRNATAEQRKAAIELGMYTGGARSFTNMRNKGTLSVRMVMAMCQTFNVSPLWLSGDAAAVRDDFCPATVNAFLRANGFNRFCVPEESDVNDMAADEAESLIEFFTGVAGGADENIRVISRELTSEKAVAMLRILYTTAETSERLSAIKLLLASAEWPAA